jgi:hypothetical protein
LAFATPVDKNNIFSDEEIASIFLIEDGSSVDFETFINESETETEKFNPSFCTCFNQFLLLDIFDTVSRESFCFDIKIKNPVLPGINGDLPPPAKNT